MTDVFISYKREERDKVVLVADRLRALGLDVWFDARLTTGHHFDREIDDHVRIAKCVLVCWSPGALTSDWVRAEAAIGRERNVIVPVLVEACTPPVPFNTLQTESLIGWGGDGDAESWLRALARIGVLTGRPTLVEQEQQRGARELETRRLQAMLEALRRDEQQAQRRAEGASAERARLEAELASRGHPPSARADRAPPAPMSAPQRRQTAEAPSSFRERVRQPDDSRWVTRVLYACVALLILGAGLTAYAFGQQSGQEGARSEAARTALAQRQAARAAFVGFWCPPSIYSWPVAFDEFSDERILVRFGFELENQKTLAPLDESSSMFRAADAQDANQEYLIALAGFAGAAGLRIEAYQIEESKGGNALPDGAFSRCSESEAVSNHREYPATK